MAGFPYRDVVAVHIWPEGLKAGEGARNACECRTGFRTGSFGAQFTKMMDIIGAGEAGYPVSVSVSVSVSVLVAAVLVGFLFVLTVVAGVRQVESLS